MKIPTHSRTILDQAADALVEHFAEAAVCRHRNSPAQRVLQGFDSAMAELWEILTDPAGVSAERLTRLESHIDRLWVELNWLLRLRRLAKRRG